MASVSSMIMASTAVMSANQARLQSEGLKQAGEAKQSLFENNARMARMQAQDAIERGEKEAAKAGIQGRTVAGSQKAALAAQGIDVTSGTASDLQEETYKIAAENQQQIRNNAWREAWGYKVQAADYSAQGQFARLGGDNEARNTLLTGKINALSQLGTAYQYSNFSNRQRAGLPAETPKTSNYVVGNQAGSSYRNPRGVA